MINLVDGTDNLTPDMLDLPGQFREFRPQQLAALDQICRSDKKVVLLQAPTGSGKTLIMAALGRILGTQILYTCNTKQLQKQVVDDFPYAVELKGRSNYPCLKNPKDYTCNECTKEKGTSLLCKTCNYSDCIYKFNSNKVLDSCPCPEACPYLVRKAFAKRSELAVLNNAFFLGEANFIGDFSGWDWVVLDEGDTTENSLMSFIEVSITAKQIERLELSPPARKTVAEAWYEWAIQVIPDIKRWVAQLEGAELPYEIREKQNFERLLRKLEFLVKQNLSQWAFIPSETAWTFKPVFIAKYADHNLWRHGERFLVMSATILSAKQFARDVGLKESDVDWIELDSEFPAQRRPVYFRPAADMSHKNKENAWPIVVRAIDEILDRYPGDKGLIHAVSYPLARYIAENSRHKNRLLEHDAGSRISTLESFKIDAQPSVLISPSMDRGVNLPDDECRFLILAKVPFPDLGDAQISRRLYSAHDGSQWYAVQTIRSIIQSTGRGMRSKDDYCDSYIIDEQFRRLYNQNGWLFPRWWKESLRGSE